MVGPVLGPLLLLGLLLFLGLLLLFNVANNVTIDVGLLLLLRLLLLFTFAAWILWEWGGGGEVQGRGPEQGWGLGAG